MPSGIDLTGIFNKTPEDIVNAFREKGNTISWNWRDTWQQAHSRAFTVAKVVNQNVLEDIRGEVDRAISEGTTFREFQNNLEPKLKAHGWWGKREIIDSETGEVTEVQLGSPHRLKTIYRTNLSTSYSAGRYKTQRAAAPRRPWWIYRTAGDVNVRPSHDALRNTILRYDDPFWDTHYPPNDWGCRCGVDSLSDRELQARGLTPMSGENIEPFAGEGWAYNPGAAPWDPITPRSISLEDILPVLDGSFDEAGPIAEFPRAPFSADRILPPIRTSGEPPEFYAGQFLENFDTTIGNPKLFTDMAGDPVLISEKLFQDFKGDWKFKGEREQYVHMLADAIKDPEEIWLAYMKYGDQYKLARRYIKAYDIDGDPEGGFAVFNLMDGVWTGLTAFQPKKGLDHLQRQRYGFLRYKKEE
jgi:SPP1 gp7 family putative phage head morphogenesis protein